MINCDFFLILNGQCDILYCTYSEFRGQNLIDITQEKEIIDREFRTYKINRLFKLELKKYIYHYLLLLVYQYPTNL